MFRHFFCLVPLLLGRSAVAADDSARDANAGASAKGRPRRKAT